jgi:hypothetical protein
VSLEKPDRNLQSGNISRARANVSIDEHEAIEYAQDGRMLGGGMPDRDRTLPDGAWAHFFGRCEAACIRHDELRVDDRSGRTTKCLRRHDTPSAGV